MKTILYFAAVGLVTLWLILTGGIVLGCNTFHLPPATGPGADKCAMDGGTWNKVNGEWLCFDPGHAGEETPVVAPDEPKQ